MAILVKDCADVTDCSSTSWDLLFCICSIEDQVSNVCTVARIPSPFGTIYPFLAPGINDSIPNLQGMYSTTAAVAETLPSTGFDPAVWSSIDNAKSDDGSYASIQVASSTAASPCVNGSEYIVLKGWGFTVPPTAIIAGIAVGVKGHTTLTQIPGSTSENPNFSGIYNVALVSNTIPYYRADPRTDSGASIDATSPCAEFNAQSPYPTQTDIAGVGQHTGYNQPWSDILSWPSTSFPLRALGVGPRPNLGVETGLVNGCVPPNPPPSAPNLAPIEKDFPIPTIKQTWSPNEVNDANFGVAVSVWGIGHNSFSLTEIVTMYLDCLGVAVYFYEAGGAVPIGNPFLSGCN